MQSVNLLHLSASIWLPNCVMAHVQHAAGVAASTWLLSMCKITVPLALVLSAFWFNSTAASGLIDLMIKFLLHCSAQEGFQSFTTLTFFSFF